MVDGALGGTQHEGCREEYPFIILGEHDIEEFRIAAIERREGHAFEHATQRAGQPRWRLDTPELVEHQSTPSIFRSTRMSSTPTIVQTT